MIKARGILVAAAVVGLIIVLQRVKGARDEVDEWSGRPANVRWQRPRQVRIAVVGDDPASESRLRREIHFVESTVPNLQVKLCMPSRNTAEAQRTVIKGLLLESYDGIVVSPVDPDRQTAILNESAKKSLLFTIDRDAPTSNRQGHVDEDPRWTGELFASELKEARPTAGKVFAFVNNARERESEAKITRLRECLAGSKLTLSGVLSDSGNGIRTKSNVARIVARESNLSACIGLSGDTSPLVVEALKRAGKLGKVKVLCSGSAAATLDAVKSGAAFCTIVVDPRYSSGGNFNNPLPGQLTLETPLGTNVQVALLDMYMKLIGENSPFTRLSGRPTRAISYRRNSIDSYVKFLAESRSTEPKRVNETPFDIE